MPRVAVVGSGAAGAAVASVVSATDVEPVVFEERAAVGGRAASRTRRVADDPDGECVTYDYGANYLKDDDERVTESVERVADPTDTPGPINTFDASGDVSPGRDADDRKWSAPAGVADLVASVLADSDATVHTNTPVTRLRRKSTATPASADVNDTSSASDSDDTPAWTVETGEGERGPFDAVVMTPPAPVTARLLAESAWDADARDALVAAARDVSYATVWSVAAGYDRSLDRPYYALVDTSDDHRAGWIARESCKPGHVPTGETLIVQGGHDWSARHAESDPDRVAAALTEAASEVIGEPWLADPDWTDATLWRHALPENGVLPGPVRDAERHALYVAGDWVAGEARLHAAFRSGLDTGERLVYGL